MKPEPVRAAELTVTDAAPLELRTTVRVVGVFNATLPNATLVVLKPSVGTVAFSCKAKVSLMPPALAPSVTAVAVVTDDAVAVNVALVAPAATVTEAGTVTAELLLDKLTVIPLPPAAVLSATVQESVPEPTMDALTQDNALNAAVAVADVPVPLRAITTVLLVEEVLATVICPVAAPVATGLNCTSKSKVPPAGTVMGRAAWPLRAKPCPLTLSWVIWTGPESPLLKVTVPFEVLPTVTLPNTIVEGDAPKVPVLCVTTTVPPQPDRAEKRPQDKIRSMAVCRGKRPPVGAPPRVRHCSVRERCSYRNAMRAENPAPPSMENRKFVRMVGVSNRGMPFSLHCLLRPRPVKQTPR